MNLHFFYHKDRRKTDMVMNTPQRLHYVPLQLLHIQRVEELAILHPFMHGQKRKENEKSYKKCLVDIRD